MLNWLHRDHLSSVRRITDATGALTRASVYQPYGTQVETVLAPLSPSEPKGWIGERTDPETGLTYLHARYYDAALGRFLSPDWWDPSDPAVGTDRYGYSLGDPINRSDPNGHLSFAEMVNPLWEFAVRIGAPATVSASVAVGGTAAAIWAIFTGSTAREDECGPGTLCEANIARMRAEGLLPMADSKSGGERNGNVVGPVAAAGAPAPQGPEDEDRKFRESVKKLRPGERVAAVRQRATEVAERNGWIKDNRLSRMNDRLVYRDKDGKYLLAEYIRVSLILILQR